MRVALSWKPSLFPLGDSDIGHNIWGLVWDPLTGGRLDIPAGARPRPASVLEGSQLCGKGSSSPEPESGERWTPFGKVNLVLGGKKTQGARKPSTVVSADVCLSVCLSSALRVCVCAGIVSGLPFLEAQGKVP